MPIYGFPEKKRSWIGEWKKGSDGDEGWNCKRSKVSVYYREVNCGETKKVKVEKSQGKVVVGGFLAMGFHRNTLKKESDMGSSQQQQRETDLNIEGPTNRAWIWLKETMLKKIEEEEGGGELEEKIFKNFFV